MEMDYIVKVFLIVGYGQSSLKVTGMLDTEKYTCDIFTCSGLKEYVTVRETCHSVNVFCSYSYMLIHKVGGSTTMSTT